MRNPVYRFHHPIQVRYGDVDAQRHVNNARYFSYMETSRAAYLQHLGLWSGKDFDQIGIILLETQCRFMRPIVYGQSLQIGVCTQRLGNKSMQSAYLFLDAQTGDEHARGSATVVAYDYYAESSILIPSAWRTIIEAFENPSE
jgi:acyl-CoA thioester hydrolase